MFQDRNLEDYFFAYLITAPRFLGYSFNPASFWYLYDEQKHLKAMIVEVNNTFDERRMYFLENEGPQREMSDDDTVRPSAMESKHCVMNNVLPCPNRSSMESTERFAKSWSKDFHVSPFNSRKGSYSMSSEDIYQKRRVDNTITLSSSKGHAKLVARIFSTGDPVNPFKLGLRESWRFVLAWWWVGLMTFPRILREAAKLFFHRKLSVWYRPEVLRDSIGRQATNDERYTLEDLLRRKLADCT